MDEFTIRIYTEEEGGISVDYDDSLDKWDFDSGETPPAPMIIGGILLGVLEELGFSFPQEPVDLNEDGDDRLREEPASE